MRPRVQTVCADITTGITANRLCWYHHLSHSLLYLICVFCTSHFSPTVAKESIRLWESILLMISPQQLLFFSPFPSLNCHCFCLGLENKLILSHFLALRLPQLELELDFKTRKNLLLGEITLFSTPSTTGAFAENGDIH